MAKATLDANMGYIVIEQDDAAILLMSPEEIEELIDTLIHLQWVLQQRQKPEPT